MNSGILTKVIEIYEPTTTKDEFGAEITSYSLKWRTRAKVVSKSGSNTNQSGDTLTIYSIEFIVRHYIRPSEYMYILYSGRKYRVLTVDDTLVDQNTISAELINE